MSCAGVAGVTATFGASSGEGSLGTCLPPSACLWLLGRVLDFPAFQGLGPLLAQTSIPCALWMEVSNLGAMISPVLSLHGEMWGGRSTEAP